MLGSTRKIRDAFSALSPDCLVQEGGFVLLLVLFTIGGIFAVSPGMFFSMEREAFRGLLKTGMEGFSRSSGQSHEARLLVYVGAGWRCRVARLSGVTSHVGGGVSNSGCWVFRGHRLSRWDLSVRVFCRFRRSSGSYLIYGCPPSATSNVVIGRLPVHGSKGKGKGKGQDQNGMRVGSSAGTASRAQSMAAGGECSSLCQVMNLQVKIL